MNKQIIEKMSLKDKKYFVIETCLMYKKLKRINSMQNMINKEKRKNAFLNKYQMQSKKNISIFEALLNLLKPEEKLVIDKEYIENPSKKNWYEEKWSKTTYYKIKHEAINNFLFLLYA